MCLVARGAGAQIDPDDSGAGDELGLAQRSNSGQVGTVTLLRSGPSRTLVLLEVRSVSAGNFEAARIRRGHRCEDDFASHVVAIALNDLRNGASRTIVPLPKATLLSGNYLVEIFASRRTLRRTSCGELHH